MEQLGIDVEASPQHAGAVELDMEGKLLFPLIENTPGIYKFVIHRSPDSVSVYVGESDRLRRRFQQYRTPGPSQRTNIRLNDMFRSVLGTGGTIDVTVITTAEAAGEPLDLTRKFERVLVENAWLVVLKRSGIELENA